MHPGAKVAQAPCPLHFHAIIHPAVACPCVSALRSPRRTSSFWCFRTDICQRKWCLPRSKPDAFVLNESPHRSSPMIPSHFLWSVREAEAHVHIESVVGGSGGGPPLSPQYTSDRRWGDRRWGTYNYPCSYVYVTRGMLQPQRSHPSATSLQLTSRL